MNKQLRKKIKELEKYLTTAKPAPSKEIVDTYNEFKGIDPRTGRPVSYTSCGSCLRRMVVEMSNYLKKEKEEKLKKKEEMKKEQEKEDSE